MRMKCGRGHVLGFGRSPNSVAYFSLFLSRTKHLTPDSGRTVVELCVRVSAWLKTDCSAFKQTPSSWVGEDFAGKKKKPHLLLLSETKPPFTHCIKRMWVRRGNSTLNKNKNTACFIWGPIQTPSKSLTKHVRAYNTLLPLDENASQLLSCLLFTSGLRSWVKVIQVNKKLAGSLAD